MAGTSPQDPSVFGIFDLKELKCTTPNRNKIYLPVKHQGTMPKSGELSGGQQQRVAIARALANDSDILLMDEPTGNLDSVAETEVLDLLQELHRKGKAVVIVTHSDEIARRAERIIRVKYGLIV